MCSYDVISGVFGCGDSKHQDQRHDGGEPGQGGDLRDHLHTHTHTHIKLHSHNEPGDTHTHTQILNYTTIVNQETHTQQTTQP